jgi:hypothetical protein
MMVVNAFDYKSWRGILKGDRMQKYVLQRKYFHKEKREHIIYIWLLTNVHSKKSSGDRFSVKQDFSKLPMKMEYALDF